MATLTKIFTGMESGPENIDDNFGNLNAELATGGPTATATVQINNEKVTGNAVFSRQGGLVVVNSYLSKIAGYDGMIIADSDIPAGFSNSRGTSAACDVVSDSHAYLGSQVKLQVGGIRLKTTNELNTSNTTDSGSWSFVYPTDDDVPNQGGK